MRPDPATLANLKRVIELGSTDAARDHGITNFAVHVSISTVAEALAIDVSLILLTPEQAAALLVEQETERRRRESGN